MSAILCDVRLSCRNLRLALRYLAVCAFLALVSVAPAAAQNSWLGIHPVNVIDVWSNAGEWSLGAVPDGSTDINIGFDTVAGDTSFTNSHTLTLGATATLILLSGTTVTNASTGVVGGTAGTLDNFGTFQGAGNIGTSAAGFPTLINQAGGTINANVSGQILNIDGVFTSNQGLLEATGGGNLHFTNGIIANQGGTITADGGSSFIQLTSSTITGGTITARNVGGVLLVGSTLQGGTLNNVSGTIVGDATTLDGSTGAGAVTIQGTYITSGRTNFLLGTINNQGQIGHSLLALAGDTILQGGGSVSLAGGSIAGTHVLTNVDNTIQGAGQIGDATNGFPTLINQAGGTINANVSGQILNIDGVFTSNQGLLEATGGGNLHFTNGIIANQGGTITADGGSSFIQLTSSTITGGTITARNVGGVLLVGSTLQGGTLNNVSGTIVGDATTLDGSTSAGAVTIQGTYTTLSRTNFFLGTIINQGNIQVAGAQLTLAGDATLQGGGSVTLTTTFLDGTHVLNNVDNTIQGAGQIGGAAGFPTLINQAGGTINANVPGQVLQITGVFTSNQGLLEAIGGWILNFTKGTITNQGGTIAVDGALSQLFLDSSDIFGGAITALNGGRASLTSSSVLAPTSIFGGTITALNGGTVGLSGADIVGGTLNNVSGTIQSGGNFGALLDGSTAAGAVTIQGTYTGSTTQLLGTISNQGNILVPTELGVNAHLTLLADTTLQGGGTVTLAHIGGVANSFIDGTHVLTNVDNTIQGVGQIGGALGFPTLINQSGGTINANVSGKTLTILGVFTSNAGLMEATGGGVLNLDGSPLTNGGTVKVDAVSGLLINAPFTQRAGKTQVDGLLIASQGENVSGGTILGHGTIYGNVTMTGGTMQPGGPATPGMLTINGDFAHSSAFFNELIDTSGNGLLVVNGAATLGPGSLLNINLLSGFTPFVGETFTLMDFLSGSGIFANAPSTGFQMDGFNWTIAYNATNIVLDAGSPVSGGGGGGGGGTTVPEPSSLILLSTGLAALLACSCLRKRAASTHA